MTKIIHASVQVLMLLFLSTSLVKAATGTIVEIEDEDGVSTIMTDGDYARMNSIDSEYVIVNLKTNQVKFVSPDEEEVMMVDTDTMPGGSEAPAIKVQLKKLGSGPKIAGYDTEKFSYSVKNKQCGVIYGSVDAAKAVGIKELLSAMTALTEKSRSMMGGFIGMMDDCEQAEMNLTDYVKTTGVPMRIEENGNLVSEIKSIKVSADLPKNAFVIPASYKTITMQDKISEVQKQMQPYQPQMENMIEQMKQSGQMSPEMIEKMRQAQEMMKQYQQR